MAVAARLDLPRPVRSNNRQQQVCLLECAGFYVSAGPGSKKTWRWALFLVANMFVYPLFKYYLSQGTTPQKQTMEAILPDGLLLAKNSTSRGGKDNESARSATPITIDNDKVVTVERMIEGLCAECKSSCADRIRKKVPAGSGYSVFVEMQKRVSKWEFRRGGKLCAACNPETCRIRGIDDGLALSSASISNKHSIPKEGSDEELSRTANSNAFRRSALLSASGNNESIPKINDKEEPSSTPNNAFKRYDKVVIVTKIHGPHQWGLLAQSMCLLHFAYNRKVHYDIVIFVADSSPLPAEELANLRRIVAPATMSIVVDNLGLREEIEALSPAKRDLFLKRCGATDPATLTWWSECPGRLAYNWQAEFRSVRLWEHPALAGYKYMLWLDSDGFPSKEWDKDPVGYFIENKGVIMFDHFPQGRQRDEETLGRIVDAFNDTSVRNLHLNPETGRLERTLINRVEFDDIWANCPRSKKCALTHVPMIHGFMHITNLDFYRQPKVMNGLKHILGDCFLCRSPDDQLAVTIPAAIYAPDKSWDMRLHGFDLKIHHNSHIDGQEMAPLGQRRFTLFWEEVGAQGFPSAAKVCKITEGSR